MEYNLKPEIEKIKDSISVAHRMILSGSTKQEILLYLNEREHTEEVVKLVLNTVVNIAIKAEIKEERGTLLGGIAMSLIGAGITFATYQYAQKGGTYVITYGIIIYGIYISIKSLIDIGEIKAKGKRWKIV